MVYVGDNHMVILPYAKYGLYAKIARTCSDDTSNLWPHNPEIPSALTVKYRQTTQKSNLCNTHRTQVFKTVPGGHLMGDLVSWFPVEPY